MMTGETKPQNIGLNLRADFGAAHSGMIVDMVDAPGMRPPETTDIFNLNARGAQGRAHDYMLANADARVSISGLATALGGVEADREKREKDEKRRTQDMLHRMLMDRINTLTAEMAGMEGELRGIYGDDFIGGMAAEFLTEEELAGAQTQEEQLAALAKKMLDDGGNIKPEYANLPASRYVQRWDELQKEKEVFRNISSLSSEQHERHLERLGQLEGQSLNYLADKIGTDSKSAEVAENALDERAITQERESASTPLPFG